MKPQVTAEPLALTQYNHLMLVCSDMRSDHHTLPLASILANTSLVRPEAHMHGDPSKAMLGTSLALPLHGLYKTSFPPLCSVLQALAEAGTRDKHIRVVCTTTNSLYQ